MASSNFQNFLDERVKESIRQYSMQSMEESAFNLLFDVRDTNDYDRGYTTIEGGDLVAFFDEQEDLKDVKLEEGYNVTLSSREFGGKVVITEKERLRDRDETVLFNRIVETKIPYVTNEMAAFVERESHKLFNDGFAGAEFLAPDGAAIFGVHTWNSTGNTFDNSATAAFSETALAALELYAGASLDAFAREKPLNLKTLVVKTGGAASTAARKILAENSQGNFKLVAETSSNVNIYNNGQYTLIETPYITDTNFWFAHASNMPNSFVMNFIKRPTVDEKIRRENLDDVFPTSGSFTFGNVYLPQDWYGSDGTT